MNAAASADNVTMSAIFTMSEKYGGVSSGSGSSAVAVSRKQQQQPVLRQVRSPVATGAVGQHLEEDKEKNKKKK